MATGQQFNLRWNNHTNNILQVFLEHLSSENLVDVTLSCQGQFLKAHKMILSACSPYFQELFRQHQVQHPIIIMNGMKFIDMKLVIEFMYRGEIKVLEAELEGLLAAAETLQVKGLSNVRNKYEKGDIQCADNQQNQQQQQQQQQQQHDDVVEKTDGNSQGTPLHLRRKRRKVSDSPGCEDAVSTDNSAKVATLQTASDSGVASAPVATKQPLPFVQVTMNDYIDDDLPATIKVEPPDIRDIDEEDPSGWESPKLVIDLPESNDFPKVNSVPQKSGLRSNKQPRIGSPSEFGKARLLVEIHPPVSTTTTTTATTGAAVAGSSRDMLLPQLLTNPREKKQNAWPKRRAGKIPRPPNAFMIFANEWRRKLAYQYPSESNKEISVRLGVMWKNLSADAKEKYYTASRQADEEHKRKYPGYYYSPKEARMNKMHKHNLALARKGNKPVDAMHLVKVFMTDMNETTPYLIMPEHDVQPKEVQKKRSSRLEKQAETLRKGATSSQHEEENAGEKANTSGGTTVTTLGDDEPEVISGVVKTEPSSSSVGNEADGLPTGDENGKSESKSSDTNTEEEAK
ncbi:uncharacterized protein LOC110832614 [Zootermopsis nevadensis]|uniref:Protein bric-a-brac 2 n=1 Tax=Zootermopsis nevadensis TaxID=136037 RepID=A0A067R0W5_ZOONE|nr:uncharacterized protein LOC110832614 [Zootermopsis nevadensis]KDR16421.1 Protein bric-a-brac 2 [Zootermopsis nevadensis]